MAGAIGKSVLSTLVYNIRRCKQVEGLCVVNSKVGHRFKSEYKAAVLQELKKPLTIDEQKRKKLQKDEVSMLYFCKFASYKHPNLISHDEGASKGAVLSIWFELFLDVH